ncbi:transporter substrate-binding domain-containing protein [Shewanella sp. WXL01]|uniref:ATP-binding protein n=1 Tax=Shewanella sp. WXL01 TaxID=2709721 RepID=UPI0014383ADC|nr:transporter substrate-binding domain-containing protein [Shewanella sp. WXL01]NKF49881.1 transporter substrate-binding domain-containing protein [Shewanella sp. WXL01]
MVNSGVKLSLRSLFLLFFSIALLNQASAYTAIEVVDKSTATEQTGVRQTASEAIAVTSDSATNERQTDTNIIDHQQKQTFRVGIPDINDISQDYNFDYFQGIQFVKKFWQYWGKENNYHIEFVVITYAQSTDELLEKGAFDIAALTTYQPTKSERYAYSVPYFSIVPAEYVLNEAKQTGLNIGVHSPYHFNLGWSGQAIANLTTDKSSAKLLTSTEPYDVIYSWLPKQFEVELRKSQYAEQYTRVNNAKHKVFLRAKVKPENKHLLQQINTFMHGKGGKLAKDLPPSKSGSPIINGLARNLSDDLQQYIIDNPMVNYGFLTDGILPYIYVENGVAKGYIVELLQKITEKTGIEFSYHTYRNIPLLVKSLKETGDVRFVPNVIQTPERMEQFNFSTAYEPITPTLAAIADHEFTHISELEGATIAVVPGAYFTKRLRTSLSRAKFIEAQTIPEALKLVNSKQADFYLGSSINTTYYRSKLSYTNMELTQIDIGDHNYSYRFGFKKSETVLRELVNAALADMSTMDIESVRQQWINSLIIDNSNNTQYNQLYKRSLLGFGMFFGILLLLAIIFKWQLRVKASHQKELEAALIKAQQAELAAIEAGKSKTNFLAKMSHEIRTPMNGILGMTESLSYTNLSPAQTDLLDTLTGSAKHLMGLLNDVLDFSKMDADKMELELIEFNLQSILQASLDNFKYKAQSAGIALSLAIDSSKDQLFIGDPSRLMQVVNNLISNAIKFTEKGSIDIRAHIIKQQDDVFTVKIDIRDTGIGIDKTKLAGLFNPFEQAESDTTRRFGGTGLGLAICREIVEAMAGEIKVSSIIGHGSLFSIVLPLKQAELTLTEHRQNQLQPVVGPQLYSPHTLSKLSVLMAEDNPVNRKVITGQLHRLGISADVAHDGQQALDMANAKHYDLIISDCHMPNLDGFGLAAALRNDKKHDNTYLIALTADALSGSAQKCLDAGFDDYLSKPCPQDLLSQKISAVIERLDNDEQHDIQTKADPLAEFDYMDEVNLDELNTPADVNLDDFDEIDELHHQLSDFANLGQSQTEQSPYNSPALAELQDLFGDIELVSKQQTKVQSDVEQQVRAQFELDESAGVAGEPQDLKANDNIEQDEMSTLAAEFGLESIENKPDNSLEPANSLEPVNSLAQDTIYQANDVPRTAPSSASYSKQLFIADKLIQLSDDDTELAVDILSVFVESAPADISKLREAYDTKSSETHNIAHKIKGSLRYLAAESLVDAVTTIERWQQITHSDEQNTLVDSFFNDLVVMLEQAQAWYQTHKVAS